MVTLSLDTTTRAGSAALARDGVVVDEAASDPAQPPATRLPRDLMALLERQRVTLDEIDVFAVCTGPGSFTGLRIGIAAMQGLAFAAEKPLIGVSGLDALARAVQAPDSSVVATWVDAWRGEVYAALYDAQKELLPPTVDAPDTILGMIRGGVAIVARPVFFVGDGAGAYREVIRGLMGEDAAFADPIAPLLAGVIARMATHAAENGHRPPPDTVRAFYVRRPDAELARSRARGKSA